MNYISIKLLTNKCPRFSYYLFLKIFKMWTILKAFIDFVTILLLFYGLVFWL